MGLLDEAASELPKIFTFLTEGRSCAIAVVNDTDSTLTVSSVTQDHGGFAPGAVPDPSIPPRQIGYFGSQSSADSVGTGCEGHMTYKSDAGFTYTIHWDNPFLGSNSCDDALTDASGNSLGDESGYSHFCDNSVGNQNATYRFSVTQI
jgi:hypothetical protein